MDLIPLEIRWMIIRHAVGTHTGEDKLSTSEALKFVGGEDLEEKKAFRASLVTSRYLIRVNKAWYEMASPFLYEYILLGRGRCVIPLRDAMVKSRRLVDANADGRAIGWWTQRLDVRIRDTADEPEQMLAALADIMACLPNLRILTFSVTGHGYSKISELPSIVLRSLSCPKSLRAVRWHTWFLQPNANDWALFLENHPNIESLRGRFFVTTNKKVKLNSLTTMYPNTVFDPSDFSLFGLPAVQFAVYHRRNELDFFPVLSQQLTIIQFNYVDYLRDLLSFKDCCPNLQQINLNLSRWFELSRELTDQRFPPTVNTLGIQVNRSQLTKIQAKHLWMYTLPGIIRANPTLKVIKFLDKATVRFLRNYPDVLRRGVQDMKGLGTTVLDHDGYPLL